METHTRLPWRRTVGYRGDYTCTLYVYIDGVCTTTGCTTQQIISMAINNGAKTVLNPNRSDWLSEGSTCMSVGVSMVGVEEVTEAEVYM